MLKNSAALLQKVTLSGEGQKHQGSSFLCSGQGGGVRWEAEGVVMVAG